MLTLKDKGLLFYIIEHCKRIEEKIKDKSKECFYSDKDIIEIVCFNTLQIGELVKNFSDDFIIIYNKMPWKEIKGMRDWVAHGYGTIDLDKVWDTALNGITPLKNYCKYILSIEKVVFNEKGS